MGWPRRSSGCSCTRAGRDALQPRSKARRKFVGGEALARVLEKRAAHGSLGPRALASCRHAVRRVPRFYRQHCQAPEIGMSALGHGPSTR